jgi:hypothetical protein
MDIAGGPICCANKQVDLRSKATHSLYKYVSAANGEPLEGGISAEKARIGGRAVIFLIYQIQIQRKNKKIQIQRKTNKKSKSKKSKQEKYP